MASILPRQNRDKTVWRVQFRIDGRNAQETFHDRKGAERFGALVDKIGGTAAREVLNTRQGATTPALVDFTRTYLDADSGLLTGVEAGTRKDYAAMAGRSFLQILGEYPVDAIRKEDVGKWLAWQERQPSTRGGLVSAKTIRNYHALLSSVLTAAVDKGHRPDNPAKGTRLTEGIKREGVFLSPSEFATVLHFIPQHYQALVMFLAGTGCRWGEATAVTWGNFNLRADPATVRIEQAWKRTGGAPTLGTPKSRRSRRTVSLYPDLVHALGAPGASTALVFTTPVNHVRVSYPRFLERVWNPSVEKAMTPDLCERDGLETLTRKPNIHDLRHSHASWLVAAGAPLPYIQNRLGHENITTTIGTYGHLVPEAGTQMANLIGATLSGVRTLKEVTA